MWTYRLVARVCWIAMVVGFVTVASHGLEITAPADKDIGSVPYPYQDTPTVTTGTAVKWGLRNEPPGMELTCITCSLPDVKWPVPADCDICDCSGEVVVTIWAIDAAGNTDEDTWILTVQPCQPGFVAAAGFPGPISKHLNPVSKRFAALDEEYSVGLRFPRDMEAAMVKGGYTVVWSLFQGDRYFDIDADPNNSRRAIVTWEQSGIPVDIPDMVTVVAQATITDSGGAMSEYRLEPWDVTVTKAYDIRAVAGTPTVAHVGDAKSDPTKLPSRKREQQLNRNLDAANLGLHIVGKTTFSNLYNAPVGALINGATSADSLQAKLAEAGQIGIVTRSKATELAALAADLKRELPKVQTEILDQFGNKLLLADVQYQYLFSRPLVDTVGAPGETFYELLKQLDKGGLALPFLHMDPEQRKSAANFFLSEGFADIMPGGIADLTEMEALTKPLNELSYGAVQTFLLGKQAGIFGLPLPEPGKQYGLNDPETCPDGQKCTDKCCRYFPDLDEWWCEIVETSGYYCANDSGQCTLGSDFCPAQ